MGQVFLKPIGGDWVDSTRVHVKGSVSWRTGKAVWYKNGSTWVQARAFDLTPPAPATGVTATPNTSTKKITIAATASSSADVRTIVVKMSDDGYPTDSSTGDGPNQLDGVLVLGDQTAYRSTGSSVKHSFAFSVPSYGRDYYFSVWCVDSAGNVSSRVTATAKVAAPVTPPPPVTPIIRKSIYVPIGSGTWDRTNNVWASFGGPEGHQVIGGGGSENRGAWFYGTLIRGMLANATKIRRFTIKIQRVVNSNEPTNNSGANVWLTAHGEGTRRASDGVSPVANPPVNVGRLLPNETKTFNVPTEWWPDFLSGRWRGLGLWYAGGVTSTTSVHYIRTFGYPSTSGQVYLEIEE